MMLAHDLSSTGLADVLIFFLVPCCSSSSEEVLTGSMPVFFFPYLVGQGGPASALPKEGPCSPLWSACARISRRSYAASLRLPRFCLDFVQPPFLCVFNQPGQSCPSPARRRLPRWV